MTIDIDFLDETNEVGENDNRACRKIITACSKLRTN